MSRLSRVLLVLMLGVMLSAAAAGCRTKPPATAPAPAPAPPAQTPAPTPPPPPPPPPTPTPAPEMLSEDEIFRRKSLEDLNREEPLESVYFGFESAELTEAARTTLQRSADYLKKRTSTKANVEGHCDARGSSEYNLGLGERRATSVRNYLVSLGIDNNRLMAVAKGEEQPQCTEETEDCWAKNRRGKFVFTAK